jgi:diaminohydroxyphosphoribosylaminopyrimidine deaminase/5-amino-6-(5-phosphoribosylamino)uracil reductase
VLDETGAMRLAVEVAGSVRASTSPNPWVGAVVLDPDGIVLATGATRPPGGDHAEVVALRAAGEQARGGTIVVTLEPCSHHGRTPPCVDAIVRAGIARVVIGTLDPDPRVAGSGADGLRSAGVDVVVGVEEAAVRQQLRAYLHHRTTGLPYVVVKMAATLFGRTETTFYVVAVYFGAVGVKRIRHAIQVGLIADAVGAVAAVAVCWWLFG